MSEALILLERHDDHTAILTVNRPRALNALNPAVLEALDAALGRCQDEGIRHIVLTGAGDKAFVAGADIAAMADLTATEAGFFARSGQAVLSRLAAYPGVVIAAVNGFALGGGMELAMACDLIVAAANARFGQPEVSLGVIPGFGGTQRLVRLVGLQRARELVFTGRMLKAPEAQALGIALEVVDAGAARGRALEILGDIATKGPVAVRLAKQALNAHPDGALAEGLATEAELFGQCFGTTDQSEGMAAFLGKRPAEFTGA